MMFKELEHVVVRENDFRVNIVVVESLVIDHDRNEVCQHNGGHLIFIDLGTFDGN